MSVKELAAPLVSAPRKDWRTEAKEVLSIPIVRWSLIVVLCSVLCFFPLFQYVEFIWLEEKDSYYSHGPLIPIIAGYLLYSERARLARIPRESNKLGLVFLVAMVYVVWVASRTTQWAPLSVLFVLCMLSSVLFIGGWKWVKATAAPILFLLFGLPMWQTIIDKYTNPLQQISTKVAFKILTSMPLDAIKLDETSIMVRGFQLDVGVPCSGLRLILAVASFMVFFILIAKLPWWKNAILAASVLPLCVALNGLRIAMIGLVGGQFGEAAGHQFHDWSGYISLVLCFFALNWMTKAMGWKNES